MNYGPGFAWRDDDPGNRINVAFHDGGDSSSKTSATNYPAAGEDVSMSVWVKWSGWVYPGNGQPWANYISHSWGLGSTAYDGNQMNGPSAQIQADNTLKIFWANGINQPPAWAINAVQNRWYHFFQAKTNAEAQFRAYIDGVLRTASAGTAGKWKSYPNIYLGRGGNALFMRGFMALPALWRTDETARLAQIMQSRTMPGNPVYAWQPTATTWRNDGTGGTANNLAHAGAPGRPTIYTARKSPGGIYP